MKIGIDISQVAYAGSGVARYTRNLVTALLSYDHAHDYIFFYSSLRKPIPSDIKTLITKTSALKEYFFPPTILNILWNQLHILPVEVFTGKLDLFFSSDWTEPPTTSAKKITTIHDLIVYKLPETSHPTIINTQKKRLLWVQKESNMVICDSASTQNDVIELLQIPKDRTTLIYPYVDITTYEDVDVKKKNRLEKPYILSVGKIEPRKNIKKLLDAYKRTSISDTDLVVVGPQGWEKEQYRDMPNIHFLGFVPDDDLYALYKNAQFFIYPSVYEGFGYPVVEAMSFGCPIATSRNSSLTEIVDTAGVLFDPHSIDDITKALITLHDDIHLREELRKKGMEQAKLFTSAKKFADEILSVFNTIV